MMSTTNTTQTAATATVPNFPRALVARLPPHLRSISPQQLALMPNVIATLSLFAGEEEQKEIMAEKFRIPAGPVMPEVLLPPIATHITVIPIGPSAVHVWGEKESVDVPIKNLENGISIRSIIDELGVSRYFYRLYYDDVALHKELLPQLHKAENITLYLVHRSDQDVWTYLLRPYMRSKELSWRRSPPSPVDMRTTSYQALAAACWNLPSPFPEDHDEWTWKQFLIFRLKLESKQTYSPPENGTTTADSLRTVSRDAPYDLLLWSGIEESFCRSVGDGTLAVHTEYASQSGGCTGRIFVRIYVPYSLAVLEVGFSHNVVRGYGAAEHRPDGRFHGVALGYRIRQPSDQPYSSAQARRLFNREINYMFSPERDGFTSIFSSVQRGSTRCDEEDSGRVDRATGIDGDELDELVSFLQFPGGIENPRAMAIRLVCAAVTVDVGIDGAGEVDKLVRDNSCGSFPWRLGAEDYWFAERAKIWCHGREMERRRPREGSEEVERRVWTETLEVRGDPRRGAS
ncbi:hypothetical protein BZA05DRAFT_471339 [Tricharina praecox]|uniref:uncharacterized protein n=1 Tax=Tricharina praecox TaxID=43433 RepID=UPI00221F2C40|nr:uncharacterized protein BZA05DRAFT_471339 [Tricharina praecox]KAI5857260.1 hypothetical protein BZA05DRAFT_471339 [Tricharina praecox]